MDVSRQGLQKEGFTFTDRAPPCTADRRHASACHAFASRVCYWLSVPTVSSAELPRLALPPDGTPSAAAAPGAGSAHRVPRAHAPPAIEICIAQVRTSFSHQV